MITETSPGPASTNLPNQGPLPGTSPTSVLVEPGQYLRQHLAALSLTAGKVGVAEVDNWMVSARCESSNDWTVPKLPRGSAVLYNPFTPGGPAFSPLVSDVPLATPVGVTCPPASGVFTDKT